MINGPWHNSSGVPAPGGAGSGGGGGSGGDGGHRHEGRLPELAGGMTDDLLGRAIGGDAISLQAVLRLHDPIVLAYVRRNLPPTIAVLYDPEDVVQDTCVEAVRRISEFTPDGPDAVARWLLTIARHRMITLVREVRTRKRGGGAVRVGAEGADGGHEEFGGVVGLLESLAVYSRTPSRSAIGHELVGVVQRLLDERLSGDQRQAVQLRHIEGLAAKEAAARMNRTEGAFHLLCNRGLKELRKGLRSKSYYV